MSAMLLLSRDVAGQLISGGVDEILAFTSLHAG